MIMNQILILIIIGIFPLSSKALSKIYTAICFFTKHEFCTNIQQRIKLFRIYCRFEKITLFHCMNVRLQLTYNSYAMWGGRVVQRCWVNFQCRGVLLIWIIVGQGPIVLAVGAGGGCLDIFPLIYHFSFLSPTLWETARYRLKYCLKGPLSPKQPTNQKSYAMLLES